MSDVAMGRGVEFDLIRRLRERWGTLAVGLGDDAAALDVPRGERILATTDSAVEGVHFRRDWLSMQEIGYRAATAALSDLAAMAARPLGVLLAISAPADARDDLLLLGDGIGDAVKAAGTVIVGGNLSQGDGITLTTTALGSAFAPLARSSARPGDFIYVTGGLGGPSAAIRALRTGVPAPHAIAERFRRPVARIAEARWLAARGAVAAIDVSDGLAADAGHLAAASGCGIDLESERVPLFPGAAPEDAFGGEEYELLLASRAPLPEQEFAARFGVALTMVGRAVEGEAQVRLTRAGKGVPLPDAAWVHFED